MAKIYSWVHCTQKVWFIAELTIVSIFVVQFMKLVLCRQKGTENSLSGRKEKTSLFSKLTIFVKKYRTLAVKIQMNKCYLSFYMPKVLAVSPFSKVHYCFLSSTKKKKKGRKSCCQSILTLITYTSFFLFQIHTVTVIIHFSRVFPQQFAWIKTKDEPLKGCDILLEKLPLKLYWPDLISDSSGDRYRFMNFRHQCNSTMNVLYIQMMLSDNTQAKKKN